MHMSLVYSYNIKWTGSTTKTNRYYFIIIYQQKFCSPKYNSHIDSIAKQLIRIVLNLSKIGSLNIKFNKIDQQKQGIYMITKN